MKITPREKRRRAFFSLPAACRLLSRGVIFTRARVSLALLSLRKSEGGIGREYLPGGGGGGASWKAALNVSGQNVV